MKNKDLIERCGTQVDVLRNLYDSCGIIQDGLDWYVDTIVDYEFFAENMQERLMYKKLAEVHSLCLELIENLIKTRMTIESILTD